MLANMDQCKEERGSEYLSGVFIKIANTMGAATPTEAISTFRNMMGQMCIQNPVAVNREEELEVLSKSVNSVRMRNNPINITGDINYLLYSTIVR
jgi:hypothetical protein